MADLRQGPPPRYRVVERDRRLIVLDTLTDTPRGQPVAPPPTATRSWLPQRISFDGSAELTTHPCYDDKGPRTIRLDPGSITLLGRLGLGAAVLAFVIIVAAAVTNAWVLIPAALLWNGNVRTRLRAAATRWFDRVAREASRPLPSG